MFITKFINNDKAFALIKVILFYINKRFYSRISFNKNIINYENTYKRLNINRISDITKNIKRVLNYIRFKIKRS